MNLKIEMMNTFFENNISECRKRENELFSDDRRDEADFEKIRANIYDIFRTVLNAALKKCGEDEAAVKDFFLSLTT